MSVTGTIHSAYDIGWYGGDIANVQTSYVVFKGEIEAVEFGIVKKKDEFKGLYDEAEIYCFKDPNASVNNAETILEPRTVK